MNSLKNCKQNSGFPFWCWYNETYSKLTCERGINDKETHPVHLHLFIGLPDVNLFRFRRAAFSGFYNSLR